MKLLQTILIAIGLFNTGTMGLRADAWIHIGSGKNAGISGIALASQAPQSDRYLIVHDNKRSNQARLGLLTVYMKRVRFDIVQWPGKGPEPADLEAMTALGRLSKRGFLVMTSAGVIFHLKLSSSFKKAKIVSRMEVPAGEGGANYEGLAVWPHGDRIAIAWGHRGRTQSPGMLYWGWLDLTKSTITQTGQASIRVPWPENHVRHISDLTVHEGQLYVSAASDPGDSGPFSAALYSAGRFSVQGTSITFKKDLSEIYRTEAHKIEAVAHVRGGFALASDDENKGSAFRVYKP